MEWVPDAQAQMFKCHRGEGMMYATMTSNHLIAEVSRNILWQPLIPID